MVLNLVFIPQNSPFKHVVPGLQVYQEDGSVAINHYGCEVGQGIHTKVECHADEELCVRSTWIASFLDTPWLGSGISMHGCVLPQVAQAAAYALGVPLDKIIVTPTTTDKVRRPLNHTDLAAALATTYSTRTQFQSRFSFVITCAPLGAQCDGHWWVFNLRDGSAGHAGCLCPAHPAPRALPRLFGRQSHVAGCRGRRGRQGHLPLRRGTSSPCRQTAIRDPSRQLETPGPILDDSMLMYEAVWPCLVLAWQGWYAPLASGSDMFKYFVHCAAATTIELHLLTGQLQVPAWYLPIAHTFLSTGAPFQNEKRRVPL